MKVFFFLLLFVGLVCLPCNSEAPQRSWQHYHKRRAQSNEIFYSNLCISEKEYLAFIVLWFLILMFWNVFAYKLVKCWDPMRSCLKLLITVMPMKIVLSFYSNFFFSAFHSSKWIRHLRGTSMLFFIFSFTSDWFKNHLYHCVIYISTLLTSLNVIKSLLVVFVKQKGCRYEQFLIFSIL